MVTEYTLPITDITQDLSEMTQLVSAEGGLDDLLRRGLDWLERVAPFDLATVFLLRGDELVPRAARGPLASPEVRTRTLSLLRFPSIRRTIEARRARAFTEDDHSHGDGDPFDGVLDLPPGHACMVAPLCAADRCFGVITLDRTRCKPYPQPVVDLVEVFAAFLALSLHLDAQRRLLARHARDAEARAAVLEAEAGGGEAVLEESLVPAVRELGWRARQVAVTDTPVLILGETGTGKEFLARAIHGWSRRASKAFVKLNCAAIPSGLLESELFGHIKGAFTGATQGRPGRFQMAHGGTLFLDEIGEMPADLQTKLLRVLQDGTFEPVGSDRTASVDVRVVAATHVDLARAIAERRFREDLYYRLAVFPLRLPPLRERLADLPRLCDVLLAEQTRRTGRAGGRVTVEGVAELARYAWPGNLRELANVLERATILDAGRDLGPDVLDVGPTLATPEVASLVDNERDHIRRALNASGGRVYGARGAAILLGLKPSTLQSRMKKLGINAKDQNWK